MSSDTSADQVVQYEEAQEMTKHELMQVDRVEKDGDHYRAEYNPYEDRVLFVNEAIDDE